jgi:cytochrome P450
VQQKLREDIRAAFSSAVAESRQPSATEIAKISIPYVDAVMEEILRFKTPVPLSVRDVLVDTQILGYRIPKGTTVFLLSGGSSYLTPSIPVDPSLRPSQAQTTHEKTWVPDWNPEDVAEFKPERWLRTDEAGHVSFNPLAGPFLAFSLGPRGCFGRRLAYMEFRIMLVLLVWNFEFQKLNGELSSDEATYGITTNPKFCYVGLKKTQN